MHFVGIATTEYEIRGTILPTTSTREFEEVVGVRHHALVVLFFCLFDTICCLILLLEIIAR